LESDPALKQLLVYLFAASRGAEMRMRIVLALSERPANTNELADSLSVDYKAIQYQLNVLTKNGLLQTPNKDSYGALYFLAPIMERNLGYVREIWNRYGKTKISKNHRPSE
jgi:predicted transcriptional regulator